MKIKNAVTKFNSLNYSPSPLFPLFIVPPSEWKAKLGEHLTSALPLATRWCYTECFEFSLHSQHTCPQLSSHSDRESRLRLEQQKLTTLRIITADKTSVLLVCKHIQDVKAVESDPHSCCCFSWKSSDRLFLIIKGQNMLAPKLFPANGSSVWQEVTACFIS